MSLLHRRSYDFTPRRRFGLTGVFMAAIGLGITGVVGTNVAYQVSGPETVRVTVTDKDREVHGSGKDTTSKYMVYTDREVFENTDSLLRGKFNSSDVQGQLVEGGTYDLTVYGFRNNFFSIFRNITDVKHVPTEGHPTAPRPGR